MSPLYEALPAICCCTAPLRPSPELFLVFQATVEDLQQALFRGKPKLYPSRQRLTLPAEEGQKKPRVLEPGKKLSDYAITATTRVTFKDLGPQVRLSAAEPSTSPSQRSLSLGLQLHIPLLTLYSCVETEAWLKRRLATAPSSSGSTLDQCWSMPSSMPFRSWCIPIKSKQLASRWFKVEPVAWEKGNIFSLASSTDPDQSACRCFPALYG